MNDDDDDVLFRLHVSAQLNRWKKNQSKICQRLFYHQKGIFMI